MKDRAEAVKFLVSQFDHENESVAKNKVGSWHYGKQELKQLFDFIYEGTPTTEQEKIREW